MNILATAVGIHNGIDGISLIFESYLFNKNELGLDTMLEDANLPSGKFTAKEKRLFNDVLSLS